MFIVRIVKYDITPAKRSFDKDEQPYDMIIDYCQTFEEAQRRAQMVSNTSHCDHVIIEEYELVYASLHYGQHGKFSSKHRNIAHVDHYMKGE